MIKPNQLELEILNNRLQIRFETTETIIAEINKNREIIYNNDFKQSLETKAIQKIEHIAKHYDGGFYIDGLENHETHKTETTFERLMNYRPQININDICVFEKSKNYFGPKEEKRPDRNLSKFRIIDIYDQESDENLSGTFVDLVDTIDHAKFTCIPIEQIILHKEYHENFYYVQNGYIGNAMYWWALDSKGYTSDIKKAHKFTEEEAMSILRNNEKDRRRNERVWNCEFIDEQKEAHITIVDSQYLKDIENGQLKLEK